MTAEKQDDTGIQTAQKQRGIQSRVDAKEEQKRSAAEPRGAMQAGGRIYPEPPFPEQHLAKPGKETDVDPAPLYDAPFYVGSQKLAGKVALITGGDSGIGRAVAVLFAREGADVAISYLAEHSDAAATQAAVEAEGRRCILFPGDVRNREKCQEIVRETVEQLGRLDVLINNAAFQIHANEIADISEEQFAMTLQTNLHGYFFMTQAAVARMAPGSAIVNTGSVTGIEGSAGLLDYSMTKGGIHAFTKALAAHLIPRGIRVNAVAPGPVWTPLNPADKPADKIATFGANTPMKRPAQPEEIAPAYVFLSSPHCSSYITGEILPIVGGY